ncbi:MAG: DNA polymerase III subunit beta [Acidimicrobiia bacterium]|nr:DNA polymerase III subunit beta [Acidimicrobiia bacterium]
MKFRCEREQLVEALGTAGRAVSSRGGSLPVLAGLRLELAGNQLTVTGSDLDLTISAQIEVAGDADGVAVIPSKLVADVVRAMEPGAVQVTVAEGDAEIAAGRSDFTLRTIPAEEFPQIAGAEGDAVTLDAEQFADALKQVVPAASSDDSRPILTGVLLAAEPAGLRLVATDSYRLAVRDLPGTTVLDEGQQVLVPSRALSELARLLSAGGAVTLRLGEREASFDVDGVVLTTRLIEGDFPNYRGLIPESHPNSLTINRSELLDAVRRVRLLAQESTPVRLSMSPDGLELIAMTQDVGQAHEALDAAYDGDELTVAFNPDYLLNGIDVSAGDEIRLETVDALKPAVLRTVGDDDFLYLLMPVRVS